MSTRRKRCPKCSRPCVGPICQQCSAAERIYTPTPEAILVEKLKEKLGSGHGRRSTLKVVVADYNLRAHLFLSANGLVADVLPNYFEGEVDGYRFQFRVEWLACA